MIKQIKQLWQRGWMIKMTSSQKSYAELLRRLKENQPFTFSRWGDGEWEAVLNLKKQEEVNCDGHHFYDSMRTELQSILLKKPPYVFGMQKLAYYKLMGRKIDQFLKVNHISAKDISWIHADVFHDASVAGKIYSFFDEMKKKNILLVGPDYLRNFKSFEYDFVEVPIVNCWLERESIMIQIYRQIKIKDYQAILFCAGMTSNWMIDQLHGNFNGFILDIGSLLDPYAGKATRNYHKKLKI